MRIIFLSLIFIASLIGLVSVFEFLFSLFIFIVIMSICLYVFYVLFGGGATYKPEAPKPKVEETIIETTLKKD